MLTGLAIPTQRIEPPEAVQSPRELSEECVARAGIYRLLSGAFVQEPRREFLEALREPVAMAALEDVGVSFGPDFTEPGLGVLTEQLACEYTVLFVASGGFPPVESVRLTGRYQQDPLFSVREDYRRAGFQVEKDRFFVFDDHLGVELLFVAELLERAAAALDVGDLPGYTRATKEVKRFWVSHLGRWVRGYARLVQRATEHSFYRAMGRLLEQFAQAEVELLKLRVDDADQGRLTVPKSEVQVAFNPDEPVCGGCGPRAG